MTLPMGIFLLSSSIYSILNVEARIVMKIKENNNAGKDNPCRIEYIGRRCNIPYNPETAKNIPFIPLRAERII
jgi:hypothetical protein